MTEILMLGVTAYKIKLFINIIHYYYVWKTKHQNLHDAIAYINQLLLPNYTYAVVNYVNCPELSYRHTYVM